MFAPALRPGPRSAVAALLLVALCWGAAYVVVKGALVSMPATDFLFWRFAVATVVLVLLRPRGLARLAPAGWAAGGLAALPLAAGYLLQTVGLRTTSAAVSGFLTGLLVVLTPLLAAVLLRERVPVPARLAVVVSTVGLAVMSLDGFALGAGEVLTVMGAVAFALHVLVLARAAPAHDALALTTVQLAGVTAVVLLLASPQGVALPGSAPAWTAVVVCALPATALAYVLQSWAQRFLSPTSTALVLTAEPVFAAAAAVVLGGELLGPRVLVGGALVLLAMVLVEGGPRLARARQAAVVRAPARPALQPPVTSLPQRVALALPRQVVRPVAWHVPV